MGFWRSRAVWIWLLTLVVGVLVIARSTFTTDMSAFLPQSPSKQQQLLVDQITVGSVSRMLLMGLEGGTQEPVVLRRRSVGEGQGEVGQGDFTGAAHAPVADGAQATGEPENAGAG